MVQNQAVNKGVILAAGDGSRLGSLTQARPKVLLPAKNKASLINSPIEALASTGINEIAIVIGYLGEKLVEALGNGQDLGISLHYITNSDYHGGNAISAYKTRDWAQGEPVVLCMGDHLIEDKLIKRLLDRRTYNDTLCVDYRPAEHHDVDEATKVVVDSQGFIKEIGKDLTYWDALDMGVFLLTENFFQATQELTRDNGIDIEISEVIRYLVSEGYRFGTCDVSGCFWVDVDTEKDLSTV